MRALRRIATPASVAVALGGCTYAFDDYLPQKTDAGLSTNADAPPEPSPDTEVEDDTLDASPPIDSGTFEIGEEDTAPPEDTRMVDTLVAEDSDAPVDTCACTKYAGGKCREWSPPGCGE